MTSSSSSPTTPFPRSQQRVSSSAPRQTRHTRLHSGPHTVPGNTNIHTGGLGDEKKQQAKETRRSHLAHKVSRETRREGWGVVTVGREGGKDNRGRLLSCDWSTEGEGWREKHPLEVGRTAAANLARFHLFARTQLFFSSQSGRAREREGAR